MKKVVLDVDARFKLERLCDYVHPSECGGLILGSESRENVQVTDVFPVPNTSKKPTVEYLKHSWGDHWGRLYSELRGISVIGDFHSHPNGTIPSAGDMQAHNDSVLHLWVIHHAKGEHTFQASRGLDHRELQLASQPLRETEHPSFVDRRFSLGDLTIDEHGKLEGNEFSLNILALPEKQRIALLHAVKLSENYWGRVENVELAEAVHVTVPTLRRWMKPLEKARHVRKYWGGWYVKWRSNFERRN